MVKKIQLYLLFRGPDNFPKFEDSVLCGNSVGFKGTRGWILTCVICQVPPTPIQVKCSSGVVF